MHSEQINEIAAALAKAQAEIKTAKFDAVNPHFKSRYATLASVREAAKPLHTHGIAFTQTLERVLVGDANGTETFLRTMVIHTSGQWFDSYYPLPNPTTIKPQEFMSLLTYAKRGSLSAIVGIASDEDDDANEAQKVEVAPRKPEVAKPVTLTDDQKEQIKLYATELSSDRLEKFLTWLNVKSLDELGQHQYDRAISGLKKAVGTTLGTGQSSGPAVGDGAAAVDTKIPRQPTQEDDSADRQ